MSKLRNVLAGALATTGATLLSAEADQAEARCYIDPAKGRNITVGRFHLSTAFRQCLRRGASKAARKNVARGNLVLDCNRGSRVIARIRNGRLSSTGQRAPGC